MAEPFRTVLSPLHTQARGAPADTAMRDLALLSDLHRARVAQEITWSVEGLTYERLHACPAGSAIIGPRRARQRAAAHPPQSVASLRLRR